ncbi:MAG: hypothetical protein Q7J35_01960 [Candidatus Methanoperedens sp.]|nr:hypothetical protein [Candidatus Methanoperedens sp.]
MKSINGVSLKNLKVIPYERGWLMEILRFSRQFKGRYAYHWERRHVDGNVLDGMTQNMKFGKVSRHFLI